MRTSECCFLNILELLWKNYVADFLFVSLFIICQFFVLKYTEVGDELKMCIRKKGKQK